MRAVDMMFQNMRADLDRLTRENEALKTRNAELERQSVDDENYRQYDVLRERNAALTARIEKLENAKDSAFLPIVKNTECPCNRCD